MNKREAIMERARNDLVDALAAAQPGTGMATAALDAFDAEVEQTVKRRVLELLQEADESTRLKELGEDSQELQALTKDFQSGGVLRGRAESAGVGANRIEASRNWLEAQCKLMLRLFPVTEENARALLADANGWAIHFSNIRLGITTFLLGACWVVLSTHWYDRSDALFWSVCGLLALTVFMFGGFTAVEMDKKKHVRMNRQRLGVGIDSPEPPGLLSFPWRRTWFNAHFPVVGFGLAIIGFGVLLNRWPDKPDQVEVRMEQAVVFDLKPRDNPKAGETKFYAVLNRETAGAGIPPSAMMGKESGGRCGGNCPSCCLAGGEAGDEAVSRKDDCAKQPADDHGCGRQRP